MSPSAESEFRPLFQSNVSANDRDIPGKATETDIKAGIAAIAALATGIEHLADALIAVGRDQGTMKGHSGSHRSKKPARKNP